MTSNSAEDDDPCALISPHLQHRSSSSSHGQTDPDLPPWPPRMSPSSATPIRPKEAILIFLALLLLVCSIMLFYKHWKKNYRDINQLPYYAYLYQKDPDEFAPVVVSPVPPAQQAPIVSSMDLWKAQQALNMHHNHHNHYFRSSTHNLNNGNGGGSADNLADDMLLPDLPRSHSSHLRSLASMQHPPPRCFPAGSRSLARTGTDPAFFPGLSKLQTRSNAVGVIASPVNCGVQQRVPRLFAAPKRASSDLNSRFQVCRFDLLRQMQSVGGLEEASAEEETLVAANLVSPVKMSVCAEKEEKLDELVSEPKSEVVPAQQVIVDEVEENSCGNSISTDV